MNKEFIPYEQALELKELGYDEECLGYYGTEGLKVTSDWYLNPLNKNSLFLEPHITNNPKISAPLYQQAFRWFREKHELSSWIYNSDSNKYFYTILFNNRFVKIHATADTYKEAELACLKELIEIVKNK